MAKVKKEKKMNPIVLFLFAIVIPGIIAIVIAIVALSFVGIDALAWAKEKGSNIPVVSNFISTDEDKDLEEKLMKANETIEAQSEQINDLTRDNESLESMIDDLEMDMKRLENRQESEGNLASDDPSEVREEVKKVSASFRKMDAEKAAGIVASLDKNVAVEVLENLSGDVRGGILAEMEPKRAAELMESMMAR